MPFKLVRNNIVNMKVDVVVNAANEDLLPGGGVCGAIFDAAGFKELFNECAKIGHCDTGKAVITKGCKLYAKYIIHTPGPVYCGGKRGEAELLYSCYKESLTLAEKNGAESIAFPLISSGIYGYPKGEALRIAQRAITDFLENSDMFVYLAVFDKNAFEASKKLFEDVESYIKESQAQEENLKQRAVYEKRFFDSTEKQGKLREIKTFQSFLGSLPDLDDIIRNKDSSFSEFLLELIDKSGMTDVQVYKRANIDRRLFSKIRSNPKYRPKKPTALAFAVALKLDIQDAEALLKRAGYAFSNSSKGDIIVRYYIENKNYNIFEINEALFHYDQTLLGC